MSNQIITSVILPIRNEENYISQCIESLLKQDYSLNSLEFIFVDGMSTDKTLEILEKYTNEYPGIIKVIENSDKTVPYAMNIGIKAALGKYIVRLDAHCEYARNYITQCIYYLEKGVADNVGGPTITKAKNSIQELVGIAYHLKIALGGGACHKKNYEGYADTVAFGAFKKETLFEIGLYDEHFTRNQDDELNFRLIKSGKKIFITPKIKFYYYPRDTYKGLFSQYYQYGWWKVEVLRKHGRTARVSHLIPGGFVLFIFSCLLLGISDLMYIFLCFSVLLIYLLLIFSVVYREKEAKGMKHKVQLMYIIIILHISYGVGFICGSLKQFKQ